MGLRGWKWPRKIAQMREKVEEKAAICLEKTGERRKQRERKDSHKKGYYNKAPGLGQDSQMFSQTSNFNNRLRIVLCT